MQPRHIVRAASMLGAGALMGAGAVTSAAAVFARKVLTPEPPADKSVIRTFNDLTITLDVNDETVAPGRYGLFVGGYDTHARIGDVLAVEGEEVTRELLGVDFGELDAGPARVNGSYFVGPPADSLGIDLHEVVYRSPVGEMPAWRMDVPDSTRWAVLVHGRGALRSECLRALPTLQRCGINALIISYRNDPGVPSGADGLYNLGLTEWQDVEAAMRYVLDAGAADIQLFGWSMGGATVLQTVDRSPLAEHVSRIVLDAPVINWRHVLAFHAGLNKMPGVVSRIGLDLMRGPLHRNLIGLAEPLDVTRADWVTRAEELTKPTLLIHSVDDDFVPFEPSQDLADARPDLVRLETFEVARHCREWNVDSERWEKVVRNFCAPASAH
ncbi:alpha/beta fold hydrolase [Yimella sp. NH-Cas1]|uniref:alpha/beta hydrolase family protein n=1 Tax=Yimella sp. NH-Cas1 TaxID=2917726 RepID=UPI001EFBC023|nr:alpha/beta fold hydrolase [Yimella sp. NH-Cas1]